MGEGAWFVPQDNSTLAEFTYKMGEGKLFLINEKIHNRSLTRGPGSELQTIAAELKIMSNNWEKFGPRITINGQKLQAPSLRENQGPSTKQQATSVTIWPDSFDIKDYES